MSVVKINYSPAFVLKHKNTYHVKFELEHGDADSYSTESCYYSMSKEDFEQFIQKFQEIKQAISDSRSFGTSLPSDFEAQACFKQHRIPVALDCYAKLNMCGYYAAIDIAAIVYYDDSSTPFDVTIS